MSGQTKIVQQVRGCALKNYLSALLIHCPGAHPSIAINPIRELWELWGLLIEESDKNKQTNGQINSWVFLFVELL